MADVTKRVSYFDRQFLRAADFQDEQAYALDRRRRHNRLLHAPGIAEGLQVSANINDAFVTVAAGTAYDGFGREIVLANSQQVPVSAITGATATAFITIAYGEQASDPSTDPGVTGNSTRMSEQPALAAGATPPASPGVILALAKVALANGKVSAAPDNSVRNQAGALIGQDIAMRSVTLRNDAVAQSTWPRLACTAANTAAVQNANLSLDASLEVFFADNGQIRSHDDNHRIVFNRANNLLELHELGDIVFSTGSPSAEKMRVTASGKVGIGTATPDNNFTVQGGTGNTYLTVKDTTAAINAPEILLGVDSNGGIVSAMTNHDLQLRSGSNTTHMVVKADGKVGIGTTTPGFICDAAGRIRLRQGPGGASDSAGLWLFQTIPNNDRAFIGLLNDNQVGFFGNTGAGWGLVMDTTTGNVGIGPGGPNANKLFVNGNIFATGPITPPSDMRFKTNIAPLTDVLGKVETIQGVTYNSNELFESVVGRPSGGRQIGLVAQDVEKVFPELVHTWHDDGYKAVDYDRFTAVLLEAVKELKSKNETLERRVEALEKAVGVQPQVSAPPVVAGQPSKPKRSAKAEPEGS
jgi:hypothetical protein